nr:MAG TPA: hypothetical protein [Caudoviricetes sp.]
MMSFKEFISPITFWYYDKNMSLKHRAIACFWFILLLPIAPVILASEHENSVTYSELSSRVFVIYVIAMWVITITGISLLVIL